MCGWHWAQAFPLFDDARVGSAIHSLLHRLLQSGFGELPDSRLCCTLTSLKLLLKEVSEHLGELVRFLCLFSAEFLELVFDSLV